MQYIFKTSTSHRIFFIYLFFLGGDVGVLTLYILTSVCKVSIPFRYTFDAALTWRICLIIKSFLSS